MEILIILFLILLNGVFSMSEIALVSARKFKLESAAKKGSSNAKAALKLAGNPNTFLSAVQIGITLIGILTGIFSGESITQNLRAAIEKVEVLQPYANSIAVTLIVIIVTFFSIVFGELIPKRIGLMFPESIASLVAKPMTIISIITKPFIWLLTKTNNLFLQIFGLQNQKEGIVSEEEIKAIVEESAQSGEIRDIEQDIVHRVFALGDRRVKELMTHRNDLVYFSTNDTLLTIKQKAFAEAHSVYPVVDDPAENPIGIVSVKDIFPKDFMIADFNISEFLKQPLMVHETTLAYKVLENFRQQKIHYGFVVDEYGVVQGLVSMDDLLDALIGDVSEYNQKEFQIVEREDGSWLADASYPFFELLNYFDMASERNNPDYNTLAGLILHILKKIPVPGEKVRWSGLELEVIDMDGARIDKVLIRKNK
jgi:putative hemolysin